MVNQLSKNIGLSHVKNIVVKIPEKQENEEVDTLNDVDTNSESKSESESKAEGQVGSEEKNVYTIEKNGVKKMISKI